MQMIYKLDFKLFLLWMLLLVQLVLLAYYVLQTPLPLHTQSTSSPGTTFNKKNAVKFISTSEQNSPRPEATRVFVTENSKISLPRDFSKKYFINFNGTICYKIGTDVDYMKKLMYSPEKCHCKQGYHGKDCGQPEVIWRAFMASRQKIIPRRRKTLRRILHAFPVINLETTFVEILINELNDVVDLFIIAESNYTEAGNKKPFYFQDQVLKKQLKIIENKIAYVPYSKQFNKSEYLNINDMRKYLWLKGRHFVNNLLPDDLLILMNSFEIPNIKALRFFKLYDGWPQPVWFRLCWSVYGFFWQHPKKTVLASGASTIQIIEDTFHNDASKMKFDMPGNEQNMGQAGYGLLVGDLNHYGGWYCSWCLEPRDLVETLKQTPSSQNIVQWEKSDRKKIDATYIEELIGSGLWLDGKTILERRSRYQDQYYAPEYVMNNTWKYESLVTNFYANIDYN